MKSIRLPDAFAYPVKIEACLIGPDQFVDKGSELFRVTAHDGKGAIIRATHKGVIRDLNIASGMIVDAPRVVIEIDETVKIPQAALDAQERDRAAKRDILGAGPKQPAETKTEPKDTPSAATLRRRASEPSKSSNPAGFWALILIGFLSAALILIIGSGIPAVGAFFWEHFWLFIGLGIVPIVLAFLGFRRHNAQVGHAKRPRAIVAVGLVVLCYGAMIVSTFSEEEAAFFAPVLAYLPQVSGAQAATPDTVLEMDGTWEAIRHASPGFLGGVYRTCDLELTSPQSQNVEGIMPIRGLDFSFTEETAFVSLDVPYGDMMSFLRETGTNAERLRQYLVVVAQDEEMLQFNSNTSFVGALMSDLPGENYTTGPIKLTRERLGAFMEIIGLDSITPDNQLLRSNLSVHLSFDRFEDGAYVPVLASAATFTYDDLAPALVEVIECLQNHLESD